MGGNGAPYVVSNFARSGTRLVASAYFVRSHSARSRLFLGMRRWYPRVCAPRRLTEGLEHPEVDELLCDLFRREIDAERFGHESSRELDLNDAYRVAVPKQDLDGARIPAGTSVTVSTSFVASLWLEPKDSTRGAATSSGTVTPTGATAFCRSSCLCASAIT